ncbi:MAG: PilZ domain-containing protein [Gammaproteobacteria bacterium]
MGGLLMSAELRKFPRVNTALEITYFTKAANCGEESSTHFFGTVTDMSRGGVGLMVENPHAPDERLFLHGVGDTNKPLRCVVKWARQIRGQFKIGVEFSHN